MLELIDWIVIALYFAGLVGIVWWSSRRQNTTADYFLAGRNVGFFVIGGSLFASNIGSEHIVGLAGQGATSGMAMAHYELHAWIMVLLAWVFVPFYYRSAVYTVPQFLEKRFNARVRMVMSVVSLLAYVLTKVSVTVFAGAVVFKALLPEMFGSPDAAFWVGAIVTVVVTGIYTVLGGLRAVLYTDTAQSIILLIGSIAITTIGLELLGGWGELQSFASKHAADFALWRPMNDPHFPWLGIIIGSPIVGIWYWCTDQYIVQRTLAAKDLRNARRGALWGGVLKVWPVLIFIIPGMIGIALHEKGQIQLPYKSSVTQQQPAQTDATATSDTPGLVATDAQPVKPEIDDAMVFPTLVLKILPTGMRGMVVAGLLAALMSSLSSLFNSSASLFTVDIYEKLNPGKSEKHLVNVGRLATLVVVVLGLIWIPVMKKVSNLGLYGYLQTVQGYLAPPITSVFLLGLFWRRVNSAGAMWGLCVGFTLCLGKTIIQAIYGAEKLADPHWLAAIGDFNFLYFSMVLFVVSVGVVVVASLLTAKPDDEQLSGLTYSSLTDEDRREIRASWNRWDVILTTIVLSLVLAMYIYFSFWLG